MPACIGTGVCLISLVFFWSCDTSESLDKLKLMQCLHELWNFLKGLRSACDEDAWIYWNSVAAALWSCSDCGRNTGCTKLLAGRLPSWVSFLYPPLLFDRLGETVLFSLPAYQCPAAFHFTQLIQAFFHACHNALGWAGQLQMEWQRQHSCAPQGRVWKFGNVPCKEFVRGHVQQLL